MKPESLSVLSFARELKVAVSGRFYVQPPADKKDQKWPMLLFLHGMNHAATLFELEAPPKLAQGGGLPLAVVSPVFEGLRWSIDMLLGVIEEACDRFPIDMQRIYVSGISIGGLATWELALRRPDLPAAIVPVCGAGQPWNAFRIAHVPTWAFHGAKDDVVPARESEAMVRALQAAGSDARLTVYPEEGHRVWNRVFADAEVWEWLLRQQKAA